MPANMLSTNPVEEQDQEVREALRKQSEDQQRNLGLLKRSYQNHLDQQIEESEVREKKIIHSYHRQEDKIG